MHPVFYAEPERIEGDSIILDETESNHAAKVMRLQKGAPVIVVDGLGVAYKGEIVKCTGRSPVEINCHAQVRNWGEPSVVLTLAAGLSSADKFDTAVQKGTELGVKRFVPLVTAKSKIKIEDPKRARNKLRRLEKVAIAAMKQCRRSYRPNIATPERFTDFVLRVDPEGENLIFHTGSQARPFSQLEFPQTLKRVTAVIGPESGFSDEEYQQAVDNGFKPVWLGRRILRAETAAQAVCTLIMDRLGELS